MTTLLSTEGGVMGHDSNAFKMEYIEGLSVEALREAWASEETNASLDVEQWPRAVGQV